jgi:hypothetical protein
MVTESRITGIDKPPRLQGHVATRLSHLLTRRRITPRSVGWPFTTTGREATPRSAARWPV